ncbi:MAG TPA: hypothetical protein VIL71_09075 [Spirillospora sp.]
MLFAAATGCSSTAPSSSGRLSPQGSLETGATPAVTAPSAMPTAQLFATALERYRAYQAAYKKAYETNDPSELSTVAIDPLLSQITEDVEANKAKGQLWRFSNTFNPRVYARSKDSTKIYIIDCVRTLVAYRYSTRTGERLDGGPGGAYVQRTTLQYHDGTWKAAATARDGKC